MGKTLGEMTPEERAQAVRRAAARFQAELDATAGSIGRVLDAADALTLTATLASTGAMCSGHRDEIPALTVTDGVPYIPAYADDQGWLWCLACARHMSTCTDAGCGHPRAVFADAVPA